MVYISNLTQTTYHSSSGLIPKSPKNQRESNYNQTNVFKAHAKRRQSEVPQPPKINSDAHTRRKSAESVAKLDVEDDSEARSSLPVSLNRLAIGNINSIVIKW